MKSVIVFILFLVLSPPAFAITNEADITNNVGWVEKLGDKANFDVQVTNIDNSTKRFQYFIDSNKPTVLILAYYSCPKMCTFLLDGVLDVVNSTDKIRPGLDYNLVALSFDYKDTFKTSGFKQEKYNKKLAANEEWGFFSAGAETIDAVTNSVGFKFKEDGDEFAHPAGIIFLTKEGRISRYLSGVLFDPNDFKLALLEASDGVIGKSSLTDKVLLYCYDFDPVGKKYALRALNVIKLGGAVTLILIIIFMFFMWIKKDNKMKKGETK